MYLTLTITSDLIVQGFNNAIALAMPSNYRLFRDRPRKAHADKFTVFPKLAPELRMMVWENCVADAEPGFAEFFTTNYGQQRELKVRHRTPALFRVNQESRYVALKAYQTFLGDSSCFLDPRKDIVFMQDSTVPTILDMWLQHRKLQGNPYETDVEERVRYMVVGGKERYPSMEALEKCGYCNLQKIILQKGDGNLTTRQEAHLSQNSWEHRPNSEGHWRFENCGHHKGLELALLTENQMDKEVRNSNEAQEIKIDV
jgi:hypothetical protein